MNCSFRRSLYNLLLFGEFFFFFFLLKTSLYHILLGSYGSVWWVFLGWKFLFLYRVTDIVRRRASNYDVVGCVWGVPRFRAFLLGPAKVPSSRFLGFVSSG